MAAGCNFKGVTRADRSGYKALYIHATEHRDRCGRKSPRIAKSNKMIRSANKSRICKERWDAFVDY